jgi:hypothetical protein
MPAPSRAEVLGWLETRLGRPLSPADQADLARAAGLDRQTGPALVADFARAFGLDPDGFPHDAYFGRAARFAPPGWPIPPAGGGPLRFPLSLSLLHQAAGAGRWPPRPPVPATGPGLDWLNLPLLLLGLPLLTAAALALAF